MHVTSDKMRITARRQLHVGIIRKDSSDSVKIRNVALSKLIGRGWWGVPTVGSGATKIVLRESFKNVLTCNRSIAVVSRFYRSEYRC